MKTLRSLPFLFSMLFMASISITGCGDSETEGCTSAFASNFDSSATKDCCCDFDIEALVDDLVGSYDFKIDNSDLTQNFTLVPITIEKNPDDAQSFIIKDFWILDVASTFEGGVFTLASDVKDFLECKAQMKGQLINENGTLKLDLEYRTWKTSTIGSSSCDSHDFTSVGELLKR